jgi:protein-L-isoaspartate(D-aspartate) O-methyltransferase
MKQSLQIVANLPVTPFPHYACGLAEPVFSNQRPANSGVNLMHAFDTEDARFNMIEQQIRPCEVIDERVLETLRSVPRERFVPEAYRPVAFADTHVPLPDGGVMMKPIQEGLMLQALAVQPGERVLEIGTGSGFMTACLQHLGGKVTSIEIDPQTSASAAERLAEQGIDDIELLVGDVFAAPLQDEAFDVVAVTGSLPMPSEKLERLLAPGGRLFFVTGSEPVMCATLITRSENGELLRESLCETLLPPLRNAPQPDPFTF